MSLSYRIIIASLLACIGVSLSHGQSITILSSGETHGMVVPCDCPHTPSGGMAYRATMIEGVRNAGPVLLLDAGGFSGGGIYDIYTEGRARDSIRSRAAIRAMGAMKYDAVAVGDEELQYDPVWLMSESRTHNVPLITANVRISGSDWPERKWVIVEREGKRFGITALTSPERLFPLHPSVSVREPFAALREVWAALEKSSDYQIVLSHLGEENAEYLARDFPGIDLIVNGHRKQSPAPVAVYAETPLLQFGFQGKQLGAAEALLEKNKMQLSDGRWVSVDDHVEADRTVDSLIAIDGTQSKNVALVYDLYIMAQCPYGLPALSEVVALATSSPRIELKVSFIGTVEPGGQLSSLHGPGEIDEEMTWLAIQELAPAKWMEFLELRSTDSLPVDRIIYRLALDRGALESWKAEHGREQLAMHYRRSTRLGIDASPTLLLNNVPVASPITRFRMAKDVCTQDSTASELCRDLPECFDDADCVKEGAIGICAGDPPESRCKFQRDSAFTMTIVRASETHSHPEYQLIESTLRLFPAAEVDTVDSETSKGRELLRTYKPAVLPLVLFDTTVSGAHNFAVIEPKLTRREHYYVLGQDVGRANYFLNRKRNTGTTVLVDPLFTQLDAVVAVVDRAHRSGTNVAVLPLIPPSDLSGDEFDHRATVLRDEAARWLAVRKKYPKRYLSYLSAFAGLTDRAKSDHLLDSLGIDIKERFGEKQKEQVLSAHLTYQNNLPTDSPVLVVVNNKEVIPAHNPAHLEDLLK